MAGLRKLIRIRHAGKRFCSPLRRLTAHRRTPSQLLEQSALWAQTGCKILGVASLAAVLGCQQISEHFNRVRPNNPVVGPPPPRISLEDSPSSLEQSPQLAMASGSRTGEIIPISQVVGSSSEPIEDSTVVAVVNSNQILASDIFSAYSRQLIAMKDKMPEDQFAIAKIELLKRDLPDHIERTLLSHALKTSLKQEQIEKLDSVLDQAFEEHVRKLLVKTGTTSALELDEKLKSEGTSLDDLRKTFGKHQLAMQYLSQHTEVQAEIGRVELLEYYNAHRADYSHPTRVKWQELRVSFAKHGGRTEALAELNKAVADLQAGKTFFEVAQKYSDGPTASNGGEWEWTTQGSLADEQVDETLFSLPLNGISRILESKDDFRVLRITAREDAHITRFEELQLEIRGKIMADLRKEKTNQVVQELKRTATIETIFDHDPELAKAMRDFGDF
ncbi:MAG: peptidyl-prolyl cis-trans isomerase [Planctomycetaceae bacterium]|nr:peptidyl-prolyl cis-trans isomerase [Planctomycetaceae bacterium]